VNDSVKKLYRSRDNVMLAGVAAGLADFLDIDPTIVRLIFAFSIFLGGTGLLVYFVMWMVVPEEPDPSSEVVEANQPLRKPHRGRNPKPSK
jgi:phage shock protein PspC (stress-responsive transcriptional regulator)